eukprot:SAG31_NODE_1913_length_6933_cov_9.849722_6_plen_59_part_00
MTGYAVTLVQGCLGLASRPTSYCSMLGGMTSSSHDHSAIASLYVRGRQSAARCHALVS